MEHHCTVSDHAHSQAPDKNAELTRRRHRSTSAVDAPGGTTTPAGTVDTSLDRPVTTRWLLRFALPTILSTLAMNTFGMIDGVFAARLIDPAAFAAVGLVFPFISFVMAVALMLSIGGSALVAKLLGEGRKDEARSSFTLLTLVTLGVSVVLTAASLAFPDLLLGILGVDEFLRPLALGYLTPMKYVIPFAMIGFFLLQYFITEGKPNLGFAASIAGGVTSVGLNFLLIGHLEMGLTGAALATGIGYSVPAFFGVVYFARNKTGVLTFVRPTWDLGVIGRSSLNGASEMVSMLAISITTVVMNNILIRLVGYEGVVAAGIMFVGQGLLMSVFLGYSTGIAPIVSYNHGLGDQARIRALFRRSLAVIAVALLAAIVLGWFVAGPIAGIYVPAGTPIYAKAVTALRIGLLGFLFMGFNGFASVFFTALSNWKDSSLLALFRTLVFILAMLSLLPALLDLTGVWLALPAAELLAAVLTVWFLARKATVYGYGTSVAGVPGRRLAPA